MASRIYKTDVCSSYLFNAKLKLINDKDFILKISLQLIINISVKINAENMQTVRLYTLNHSEEREL